MLRKLFNRLVPIFPYLFLFFLPVVFFYPVFQGKIIAVGDFSGSDLLDLHLPFKYAIHESISNGNLPIWNKDLAMGFPILAEGQAGVFYPINLILSVIPPYMALNFSILATFIIAGWSMYLFLKSLSFSRFSSLFSAVAFSYSAFFITRIKHLNLIAVASWAPLVFYLIKKSFDTKKTIYNILIGVVICLQFLAGHPNMTFLCIFMYLVYWIFEIINHSGNKGFALFQKKENGKATDKSLQSLLFGISSIVTSLLVGALLSSVQIIPTLELMGLTERQSFTYANATAYPFTLRSLMTFFAPYNYGNPATGSYKQDIVTDGIFWENASYIGILPFALVIFFISNFFWKKRDNIKFTVLKLLGVNKTKHQKNESFMEIVLPNSSHSTYIIFFFFLSMFSLLLMLGSGTPVYKFIWENVPGFSLFRLPNRFNLFLIMSLSAISGYVAETLLKKLVSLKHASNQDLKHSAKKALNGNEGKEDDEEETRISWPLGRKGTAILLISFLVADLSVFANSYIGYVDAGSFLKTPKSVEKLKGEADQNRIYSVTEYGESPYQILGWKNMDPLISLNPALAPNKNIIYQISSFNDRGWFEGGLSLARRNKVEKYLLYENKDEAAFGKILGLFNVKYLLHFGDIPAIELYKEEEYDLGSIYSQKLNLTRNDQNLPRTYFVPEGKVVNSDKEAFDNIISISHLGPKTVILEDDPKQKTSDFNGVLDNFKKDNPVKIEEYGDTKVTVSAKIKDRGFLVLSDIYYPGWKVFIDGKEDKILKANYLVRAVELDPGDHEVIFSYDPISFKIGAATTLLSALVIIILVIFYIFRSKKQTKNKADEN